MNKNYVKLHNKYWIEYLLCNFTEFLLKINYFPFLYSISYAWYAFIGTVMTFSIGFVTSLFFKEEPKMDKDLYCFTIRKFITSQDESLENSSDNQELKSIQEKTYHLNNAA